MPKFCLLCLQTVVAVGLLGSCAALRVDREFLSGRNAYLRGEYDSALAYFQSVAQKQPEYAHGTALRQSILSYVGRSEYATGRYAQAQNALEKALSAKQDNALDLLYLGLTRMRSGDRTRGLVDLERGMRGVHEWLEYVTEAHRLSFGQFWDPRREIRAAIESDLVLLRGGKEIDCQKLLASAEWLGKAFEEESDRARDDERRDHDRDSDDSQP